MSITDEIIILPPNSDPLGLSYNEWAKEWCKWLLSVPRNISPAFDPSGKLTTQNQHFPSVFFLSQTIESVKPLPCRIIKIPQGTHIFMPVINWISVIGGNEKTEEDLKNLGNEMMDRVVKLELTINGQPLMLDLKSCRAQSPLFEMVLPNDNVLDVSPGPRLVMVDGFWIFFKPLLESITVQSYGACRSGLTQIGATFFLKSD